MADSLALIRGAGASTVIRHACRGVLIPSMRGKVLMVAVMIGIDPHKGSHTAVAISAAEQPLGSMRIRACLAQAEQLMAWAAAWPERVWAVEGAAGSFRACGGGRSAPSRCCTVSPAWLVTRFGFREGLVGCQPRAL